MVPNGLAAELLAQLAAAAAGRNEERVVRLRRGGGGKRTGRQCCSGERQAAAGCAGLHLVHPRVVGLHAPRLALGWLWHIGRAPYLTVARPPYLAAPTASGAAAARQRADRPSRPGVPWEPRSSGLMTRKNTGNTSHNARPWLSTISASTSGTSMSGEGRGGQRRGAGRSLAGRSATSRSSSPYVVACRQRSRRSWNSSDVSRPATCPSRRTSATASRSRSDARTSRSRAAWRW